MVCADIRVCEIQYGSTQSIIAKCTSRQRQHCRALLSSQCDRQAAPGLRLIQRTDLCSEMTAKLVHSPSVVVANTIYFYVSIFLISATILSNLSFHYSIYQLLWLVPCQAPIGLRSSGPSTSRYQSY